MADHCTCVHCGKHFHWRGGHRISGIWFCRISCYRAHFRLNSTAYAAE